ncbi:MAG: right-handed parallel beta-helix repeat-containing protein [Phycisphaerales bacterium]|nr:right-handed parallel beta-helix repeat-containing protein [Phycisphaerales bacterium]
MVRMMVVAVLVAFGMAACAGPVAVTDGPKITSEVAATTVSTFHCLSLYWSPKGGAVDKQVFVMFRETDGGGKWRDGLPMVYNPVEDRKNPGQKTVECKGDYRGSLVNLKPGTTYEIVLTLQGTDITTALTASTWSENFPIAQTIKCGSGAGTLEITHSGTPNGYILYDGTGSTIDTDNKYDMGININAQYVIIRGFTIKNVKMHGIRIEKGNNVIIENCDISKWGSEDKEKIGYGCEMHSGVYSRDRNLHGIVVQRCRIHHPTWDTNSWAEDHVPGKQSRHPDGPQAITYWEPEGNNVIRYNEFWSDPKHYFNDVIGGAFNGSYRGWPGRDSDIYCNYIANCWDDGIESEGGNQNVRIWNNYIEETMIPIANAATSIGPLYIWNNVSGRSYTKRGSMWGLTHGGFMKMGFAGDIGWMTGHMYIFNNTIFQANDDGADALGGSSRVIKHCVTRNNIFHTRSTDTHSISTDKKSENNDFDYDLHSGRVPEGSQKNGIKGTPKYAPGVGFNFETKTGNFQLSPSSLGYRKGVAIPNFLESNNGRRPDVGAHQSGTLPMVFGVEANFVPAGR